MNAMPNTWRAGDWLLHYAGGGGSPETIRAMTQALNESEAAVGTHGQCSSRYHTRFKAFFLSEQTSYVVAITIHCSACHSIHFEP
jgi:hypothetical protein